MHLHETTLKKSPQPISLPETGSVFDFYVDNKTGTFIPWSERQMEKVRKVVSSYTVVPEVCKLSLLFPLTEITSEN